MFAAHLRRAALPALAMVVCWSPAMSEPLAMTDPVGFPGSIFQQILPEPATPQQPSPDVSATEQSPTAMPARLRRQVVAYDSHEASGTIVIDTPHAYLYYVLGGGRAIRYGIGVGREGFTWSGVRTIDRKVEWPDWYPPAEMIERQPYLPRFMAGGPANPLGARAMYLGGTLYRIHGTSDPSSIGKHVSSGCIRLFNADAIDLYNRTSIGTKVVVLPDSGRRAAASAEHSVARQRPHRTTAQHRVSQAISPAPDLPQSEPAVRTVAESTLHRGSFASRLY